MNIKKTVKKILAKKIAKPVIDYKYDIPKLPPDLAKATSKRDGDYLKYINKLFDTLKLDPMTGLYNKQHFEQIKKDPGVYLYIDGDGIKQINSEYGHEAGHAAILALAAGIKSVLRKNEEATPSRVGGDEFSIHLEGVSIATGVLIGKRIIESINKQDIGTHYKGSDKVKKELSEVKLGASIGVGYSKEEADDALYKAKAKGRNRVEYFTK